MLSPETDIAENPEEHSRPNFNRRQFLATATAGFVYQFVLPSVSRFGKAMAATTPVAMNSYIEVNPNNTVTIFFGGCELGQGAMSGLAQIAAEELMVEWSQVRTLTVPPEGISYITGGSSAIRDNYLPVRTAAAAVRVMMIQAGANTWGVAASTCYASNGFVIHQPTGRTLSYASLSATAATITPPTNPPFIANSAFRLIGKPVRRLDIPSKVNGSAKYGIDTRVAGMVYAVVKHTPSFGGTLVSTPAARNGVTYVGLGNAVAAVAATTWDAMNAFDETDIHWNIPASAADLNDATFTQQAATVMAKGPFVRAETLGNPTLGLSQSEKFITATYTFPYLAHACMEVLNCTVDLTSSACTIWAPTQAAAWVQGTAAALTGLPASKITVHTTLLGGGLGRKIEQDYIAQAVQVAMAVKKPVKLTWPREEDFGNDMYRPMAVSYVRSGLNSSNQIAYWLNKIVTPSILAQRGWISAGAEDGQATEGATGLPYSMGSRIVNFGAHPSPIPIGFWRSVGLSFNGYVVESFIDEIAASLGLDPYQYRRTLLSNQPRFLKVLDAAATLGGWTEPLASGHGRGIAIVETFGTVVAEVVEISNVTSTSVKVVSVACAVDCGLAINPDSIQAQMEGGIVHAMGATLWGHIDFTNGASSVRNFDNYRLVRMSDMPKISVEIITSTNAPSGTGEPGVPPFGPAFANAYFRATGTRVRTLPFYPAQSHMSDD